MGRRHARHHADRPVDSWIRHLHGPRGLVSRSIRRHLERQERRRPNLRKDRPLTADCQEPFRVSPYCGNRIRVLGKSSNSPIYTIRRRPQNYRMEDIYRVTVLRPVCFALLFAPAGFCADAIPARVEAKPTMIERVAASISVHEGWNDLKSLVRRQHNPGALIYVGQAGARKGRNGYAWFKTDEDGKAALLADLRA